MHHKAVAPHALHHIARTTALCTFQLFHCVPKIQASCLSRGYNVVMALGGPWTLTFPVRLCASLDQPETVLCKILEGVHNSVHACAALSIPKRLRPRNGAALELWDVVTNCVAACRQR